LINLNCIIIVWISLTNQAWLQQKEETRQIH